jgi:hypothetical protein
MAVRTRRFAPLGLAALLLAELGCGVAVIASTTAATSTAALCIPSVTGSGPTVYIRPDYAHQLQSQVYYDSSALDVQVTSCL